MRKLPDLRPKLLLASLIKAKGLNSTTAQSDGTAVCYALMLAYDPITKKSSPRWSVAGVNENNTYEALNEGTMTCCQMISEASSDETIAYENKTMPLALAILTYGRARAMTEEDYEKEMNAELSVDEQVEKFAKELEIDTDTDTDPDTASEMHHRARVISLISMEGKAHQAVVFDADGSIIEEDTGEQWTEETGTDLISNGNLDDCLLSAFSLLVMCASIVIDRKELSEKTLADLACTDPDLPSHLRTKILRATFMTATECGSISLEVAVQLRALCEIIATTSVDDED